MTEAAAGGYFSRMHPAILEYGQGHYVSSYGVAVSLAALVAFVLARRWGRADGMPSDFALDMLLICFAGGYLGSQAVYVLSHWSDVTSEPMKALAFWRTPHSFFGSFLGVVLLAAGWCWRSSVSPLELLDTGLPVAAVGMSIGRLGCFAAGCCYGAPTEVPWSVTFRSELAVAPTGVPLHPTQLYEAASWAVLAAALVVLRRRPKNRRPKGVLALVFLSGSAVSRFTIEIYRGANHPWNDLSGAQIASLIVLLCCAPLAWCGVRERRLHRSRSGGRMRR